ncbi:arrestin domain-containing protein 17-like isoform X2 [Neocloeon triangulifer]|nr:arrestin domain-containing protein 17-like isoform X2 [Neocloeon triangulifer]
MDGQGSSHSKSEPYFNHQTVLLGGAGRGSEICLAPGEHFYPFNFDLPANIPSSFEGEHGHIRYCVSASMDRQDRAWKLDLETSAPFAVIALLDLNSDPQFAAPVSATETKKFSFSSGVVNVVLSLPAGGVVPGEILRPTLDVKNNSKAHLDRVRLKLRQVVTYIVSVARVNICYATVAMSFFDSVKPGQSLTFEQDMFKVPPLPPSNKYLEKCNVIEVGYVLKASFSPRSSLHSDFHVGFPVVVGTIPLRANLPQLQAPPTYETCLLGTASKVKKTDKLSVPKYPVYHN